jgi:4-amino-4-deoxy-L-arabinose transferase-like glycosyltransferase
MAPSCWLRESPSRRSFFGYHNLQRFTSSVVNDDLQPWWFFLPMLVDRQPAVHALLLLGLAQALGRGRRQPASRSSGLCRLLAAGDLWLSTVAATKLPSYWLPATPAAGLLIALAAQDLVTWRDPAQSGLAIWRGRLVWLATLLLTAAC